jgi:DNA adenine methylase
MFTDTMKKLINVPHPIPYQGSKRVLAGKILEFFPSNVKTLVEPFAGSAAVSLAAAITKQAKNFHMNDLNEPLINLWKRIILHPDKIALEYEILWKKQKQNPENYYRNIREKFNQTKRPDYFLYLLARCVKASVRYNANGDFNQSSDKRRLGTRPATMRTNISYSSFLLKGKTKFSSIDYKDVLKNVGDDDLVYMDPPYQGVCGNRDNRYLSGIQINDFVNMLENLNDKGVNYIVSYDGRTGNKTFGQYLPDHLKLRRIEICAGRSTQATLLGRKDFTYESLYLSPNLTHVLANTNMHKKSQCSNKQFEFIGVG